MMVCHIEEYDYGCDMELMEVDMINYIDQQTINSFLIANHYIIVNLTSSMYQHHTLL